MILSLEANKYKMETYQKQMYIFAAWQQDADTFIYIYAYSLNEPPRVNSNPV